MPTKYPRWCRVYCVNPASATTLCQPAQTLFTCAPGVNTFKLESNINLLISAMAVSSSKILMMLTRRPIGALYLATKPATSKKTAHFQVPVPLDMCSSAMSENGRKKGAKARQRACCERHSCQTLCGDLRYQCSIMDSVNSCLSTCLRCFRGKAHTYLLSQRFNQAYFIQHTRDVTPFPCLIALAKLIPNPKAKPDDQASSPTFF